MAAPKWKIRHLTRQLTFPEASDIILKSRMKELKKTITAFFTEESAENLHLVRIAFRRLRYSMELFYGFYDRKKFKRFYDSIAHLQNASGNVRDNYILQKSIALIEHDANNPAAEAFIIQIADKEKQLTEELKQELAVFLKSPEFKDFMHLVK